MDEPQRMIFEVKHCCQCHKHLSHHRGEDEHTYLRHADRVIKLIVETLNRLSFPCDEVAFHVNHRIFKVADLDLKFDTSGPNFMTIDTPSQSDEAFSHVRPRASGSRGCWRTLSRSLFEEPSAAMPETTESRERPGSSIRKLLRRGACTADEANFQISDVVEMLKKQEEEEIAQQAQPEHRLSLARRIAKYKNLRETKEASANADSPFGALGSVPETHATAASEKYTICLPPTPSQREQGTTPRRPDGPTPRRPDCPNPQHAPDASSPPGRRRLMFPDIGQGAVSPVPLMPERLGMFEVMAFDLDGALSHVLYSKRRSHRFPELGSKVLLSGLLSFLAANAERRGHERLLNEVSQMAAFGEISLRPLRALPRPTSAGNDMKADKLPNLAQLAIADTASVVENQKSVIPIKQQAVTAVRTPSKCKLDAKVEEQTTAAHVQVAREEDSGTKVESEGKVAEQRKAAEVQAIREADLEAKATRLSGIIDDQTARTIALQAQLMEQQHEFVAHLASEAILQAELAERTRVMESLARKESKDKTRRQSEQAEVTAMLAEKDQACVQQQLELKAKLNDLHQRIEAETAKASACEVQLAEQQNAMAAKIVNEVDLQAKLAVRNQEIEILIRREAEAKERQISREAEMTAMLAEKDHAHAQKQAELESQFLKQNQLLEARVTELSGVIENQAVGFEAQLIEQRSAVETMAECAGSLQSKLAEKNEEMEILIGREAEAKAKLVAKEANFAAILAEKDRVQAMREVEWAAKLVDQAKTVQAWEGQAVLATKVAEQAAKEAELDTKLAEQAKAMQTHVTRTAALEAKVAEQAAKEGDLEAKLLEQSNAMQSLTSRETELRAIIESHAVKTANLEAQLAEQKTAMQEQAAREAALQSALSRQAMFPFVEKHAELKEGQNSKEVELMAMLIEKVQQQAVKQAELDGRLSSQERQLKAQAVKEAELETRLDKQKLAVPADCDFDLEMQVSSWSRQVSFSDDVELAEANNTALSPTTPRKTSRVSFAELPEFQEARDVKEPAPVAAKAASSPKQKGATALLKVVDKMEAPEVPSKSSDDAVITPRPQAAAEAVPDNMEASKVKEATPSVTQADSPAKKKGAAALLKGFRTGELTAVVDKMEANEALSSTPAASVGCSVSGVAGSGLNEGLLQDLTSEPIVSTRNKDESVLASASDVTGCDVNVADGKESSTGSCSSSVREGAASSYSDFLESSAAQFSRALLAESGVEFPCQPLWPPQSGRHQQRSKPSAATSSNCATTAAGEVEMQPETNAKLEWASTSSCVESASDAIDAADIMSWLGPLGHGVVALPELFNGASSSSDIVEVASSLDIVENREVASMIEAVRMHSIDDGWQQREKLLPLERPASGKTAPCSDASDVALEEISAREVSSMLGAVMGDTGRDMPPRDDRCPSSSLSLLGGVTCSNASG